MWFHAKKHTLSDVAVSADMGAQISSDGLDLMPVDTGELATLMM